MPTRTCIGCNETDEKNRMIRIVDQDGLDIDQGQNASGRGTYVHPVRACIARAMEPRRLARGLRKAPDRYAGPLLQERLAEMKRKAYDLCGTPE